MADKTKVEADEPKVVPRTEVYRGAAVQTEVVVEEAPLVMPDPQPAFHALDKYKSVIGGHGPRSDEEIVLCDEAHDALDDYFAAKDAVGVPLEEPPVARKGKKTETTKHDYSVT